MRNFNEIGMLSKSIQKHADSLLEVAKIADNQQATDSLQAHKTTCWLRLIDFKTQEI